MVLYILKFIFFIANWITKYAALNDKKHSLTSICYQFLPVYNFFVKVVPRYLKCFTYLPVSLSSLKKIGFH